VFGVLTTSSSISINLQVSA